MMFDLVISLVILAALALALGAITLWRRGQRRQASLMGVLVLVMLGNAVIWLAPNANGDSLAEAAGQE